MSIPTRSESPARPRASLAPSPNSPEHAHDTAGAALAVMACVAAVLGAWAMGAAWLGAGVFGIPVGIWLAGLGAPLFVMIVKHRDRVVPVERLRAAREFVMPRVWPTEGPNALLWDAVADRADRVAAFLDERGFGGAASRWLGSLPWPTRPVTIGLLVPDALADALIETPSSASRRVDWLRLDPERAAEDTDSATPDWLDAVVRFEHGRLVVECPERPGRDAAWFDWAHARPLTLASVFPFRYDPARITIAFDQLGSDAPDRGRTDETRVIRDLIEAAAVLSRTPDRLALADLIAGRRPLAGVPGAPDTSGRPSSTPGDLARARQHEAEIIRALGEALRRHQGRERAVLRVAARVVSAWSVHEPGQHPLIDDQERVRLASLAAVALTDEAEPDLRLGALRLSAGDDEAAFAALLDAERVLRDVFLVDPDPNAPPAPDQAALVQASIEHGADDELTVGRVAAGIVLLAAGTPTDRLPFMRDDLIDEFRYAGWLVGRDNDEFVLRKLFREIEQTRNAEPVGSIGEHGADRDTTDRAAA